MAALSILLCLHLCFICSVSSELGTTSDMKELSVGLELHNETLPLQMGSRYYKLIGLKPLHWYEVKISYPASIPASFSIELKRGNFEQERAFSLRRLLNTEKLIFRSGGHSLENNEDTSEGALVYVQPEGVVAKPHLKDMFNIVCDELLLGIPYKAWVKMNGDWVTATPDVYQVALGMDAEFLILASDGLWDYMSCSDAVRFVRNQLCQHGDVQSACEALALAALNRKSQDNVSVVIADLGRTNWQAMPPDQEQVNIFIEFSQAFATIGIVSLGIWLSHQFVA